MPEPKDPFPTVHAVDRRLREVARILASPNITASYAAGLRRETDQLLDRRAVLTMRERVQTG